MPRRKSEVGKSEQTETVGPLTQAIRRARGAASSPAPSVDQVEQQNGLVMRYLREPELGGVSKLLAQVLSGPRGADQISPPPQWLPPLI